MTWTAPNTASAGSTISASDHNTYIRDNLLHLYGALPVQPMLWHIMAQVTAGNALATTTYSATAFAMFANQNAAADGDTFTQQVILAPGDYNFYVLGVTKSASGKIDWTLGGDALITGQDWYSASDTYSVLQSSASAFTVATGGVLTLTGTTNGKHASASAYTIRLTCYWFIPA